MNIRKLSVNTDLQSNNYPYALFLDDATLVQDTISYLRSVLDIQISFLLYMKNFEKDKKKYKFVQNPRIFPQHSKRNMEKLQLGMTVSQILCIPFTLEQILI